MHADARQTEFCTYLSAILLGGLLLNAVWGWWWADPLAALVMVPIIPGEGVWEFGATRAATNPTSGPSTLNEDRIAERGARMAGRRDD